MKARMVRTSRSDAGSVESLRHVPDETMLSMTLDLFRKVKSWLSSPLSCCVFLCGNILVYLFLVLTLDMLDVQKRASVKPGGMLHREGLQDPRQVDPVGLPGQAPDDSITATIPHIIHQIWDTRQIPQALAPWIQSWEQNHPDWEYWLWTLDDGRELIKERYPEYLSLYDAYEKDIFRIDAMRLFILHAFGGFYADIDMISLRPMHDLVSKHQCILSEETPEHSYVVSERNVSNVVNGFMVCRPGHPFFTLAIKSLPEAAREHFGDFLHATGPWFVDDVLHKYNNTERSRADRVSIFSAKYFLPTFDPDQDVVVSHKCSPKNINKLPPMGQETCHNVWSRDFQNQPYPESYTDHKWMHLYMYHQEWKTSNTQDIFRVIPNAINISRKIMEHNHNDHEKL